MIIVKLKGGIGNQMFQYACGKALAHRYNVQLKLDHSFLEDKSKREDFTYRDYELSAFNIDLKLSLGDLKYLGLFPPQNHLHRYYYKVKRIISGYEYWNEKQFNFDYAIFDKGNKLCINGYFQSAKYFENISDIIRADFSFIPQNSDENHILLNHIQVAKNPVCVHVRRGDYLTIGGGTAYNICSLDYYKKAVNIIKNKVNNPTFFVFSADDPQWAINNLDIGAPFEIIGNQNTGAFGYENMRLMSLCRHNIIANSSFSWWGAWLNIDPAKIVIAPRKWFNDETIDTSDLLPETWIKL